MDYKKRCEDCACLVVKNGKWCCDECFGVAIEEVDDCPEGVTVEKIEEITDKAKSTKIDHGARENKEKAPRKPKTVKISDEKQKIFDDLVSFLAEKYDVSIETNNKLLIIKENGKEFKLNLSETRQKKEKS